ncbi:choice-of-anchor W domain-containing protein [Jannaschia sp. LMIT008]|uniref:choice-of-anchor W domain-containing protein n=1 Tax=Jannaschia maritima TaxID=3032585 RepID=UPI002811C109|nr:choice-of-anchor W domain-containing protein [Jannaschia sp. LMIT008]
MKILGIAAALVLCGGSAFGATQVNFPASYGDAQFRAECGANGNGTQGCETAVAQVLGGDGEGGGQRFNELKLVDVVGGVVQGQPAGTQAQFDLANQSYRFSLDFDASTDILSLTFGGTTITRSDDLAGTRSLFIRNRNDRGSVSVSNLMLGGMSLDGLPGSGTNYTAIGGVDFTSGFSLTGDIAFDFTGSNKTPNAATIVEFKFTDLDVAPIPLPAGGLLLLGGLGALGAMRARRTRG